MKRKRARVDVEEESNSYFAMLLTHSEQNDRRLDEGEDEGERFKHQRLESDDENGAVEGEEGEEEEDVEQARQALFQNLEKRRQARLKAINEQASSSLLSQSQSTTGTDVDAGLNPWGASDEEPDEDQAELMCRTASYISSSPNPTQLEMRILANHGADPRFSFLKGRWARSWRRIRASGGVQKENEDKVADNSGLGGLDAYGSDDDEDEGQ